MAESHEVRPRLSATKPSFIRRYLGIDYRGLAALRILFAILILIDLFIRARYLSTFYTDAGVMPRWALAEHFQGYWKWSLHAMSGSKEIIGFLFFAHAVAALLMGIGYRTRLFTIITWVLTVSLINRSEFMLQGFDEVLKVMLFWMIFLPIGRVWSADQWRRALPRPSNPVKFSAATVAILTQVIFIYFFSALLKTDAQWRTDGTAIYYALSIDTMAKGPAQWLLQYPALMKVLTFGVFYLELLGPILLLVPFYIARIRTVMVALFMGMHMGLWFFIMTGPFSFLNMASMVIFLPYGFWNWLEPRLHGIGLWFAARFSRLATPLFQPFPPAEKFVTRSRDLIIGFFLFYVFIWQLVDLTAGRFKLPANSNWIGLVTGMGQKWGFFAPLPPEEDGYYVIPGRTSSGKSIDLYRGDAPLNWTLPADISGEFPDFRWQKYLANMHNRSNTQYRLYYGQYICRNWNAKNAGKDTLLSFSIYLVHKKTPPPGQPTIRDTIKLWDHRCF